MRIRSFLLVCAAGLLAAAFAATVPQYLYGAHLLVTQGPNEQAMNTEVIRLTAPLKLEPFAATAAPIHVDVNGELKGDRLSLQAWIAQDQELPDGTPVEEKLFHDEEERASATDPKR